MKPQQAALSALVRRDPALGRALRRVPPFPGFPDGSPEERRSVFQSVSRSIVHQMVSTQAAAAICARLSVAAGCSDMPEEASVAALSDERLRACGLSRAKVTAIRGLAERTGADELALARLERAGDEEVIRRLTQIPGVGTWTAQMFLIFRLGRLDIVPAGDVRIREGLRLLDGGAARPTAAEARERFARWRPLASVASWVLWRLGDAPPTGTGRHDPRERADEARVRSPGAVGP